MEIKEFYLQSFIEYLGLFNINGEKFVPRYKSDGKLYFDEHHINKHLDHFAFIFKKSFNFGQGIGFSQGYDKAKIELIDVVKVKLCHAVSTLEI